MKNLSLLIMSLLFSFLISCNGTHSVQEEDVTLPLDTLSKMDTAAGIQDMNKENINYKSYCNQKFDYCIDFPAGILYPQGEAGNGDGQAFKSKNGENTLLVYRDFRDNMDPEKKFTIESAYNDDLDAYSQNTKRTVSYKKISKTFYVISGYNDKKIFYQKTILANGQLATCMIEYSPEEKGLYNILSERIFDSFK